MKKNTKKKNSLLIKILIPTLLIVIILSTVLASFSYNNQKKSLISTGVAYSTLFSKIALNTIDPVYFNKIYTDKDTKSDAYKYTYKALESIKNQKNISCVYTLYFENNTLYYGVHLDDSKTSEQNIGKKYDYITDADTIHKTLKDCQTYYYEDLIYQNGIPYLIAITPLYDQTGKLLGAVGCEYDASLIIKTLNETSHTIITVTIVLVIICTIIIFLLMRKIINNITIVNNKMITLTDNEGDLTQTLTIKTGDEFEEIANNTNNIISSIHGMILNIVQNTKLLEENTSSSFNIMQETYKDVNNTDNELKELNAYMTDVIKSCNHINISSNNITGIVNTLTELIETGTYNSTYMRNIATDSNALHSANYNNAKEKAEILTKQLNVQLEKSKEIIKISNLASAIIDITEQTSLLALNASIESARSGEHGKGFTLVAEEIGKLSTITETSAIQIQKVSNDIINSVEDLTSGAHLMLDYLNNVLFKGYNDLVAHSNLYFNDSKELSNTFEALSTTTKTLTDNINNIRTYIKSVNSSINSNAINIEEITYIYNKLTKKNKQLYSQLDEINNVCDTLNNEVNKFKY